MFKSKKFIAIFIGLILSALLAPIKQLGFVGISHCGRVLSEIDKEESSIMDFLSSTGKYTNVTVFRGSALSYKMTDVSNNLDVIWKIGVNNPHCFSNHQQSYIDNFKDLNFRQTIYRIGSFGYSSRNGGYDEISTGDYIPVIQK
jgi:hypothetical protein